MLYGIQRLQRLSLRVRHGSPRTFQRRHLLTLAIETSCDDTCVAVLEKNSDVVTQEPANPPAPAAKLHFNEKITAVNKDYRGIHPLVALESHGANLGKLINKSLTSLPDATHQTPNTQRLCLKDGTLKRKPDFISVTRGPGMRSNLVCGLDTAKGLSTAWQIPMLGVHHMQAHALTPRLVHALSTPASQPAQPAFPFLTLLISGGHTMLLHSKSLITHTILATTRDKPIGDALDKAGRAVLPAHLLASANDTAYAKHLSNYAFPGPDTYTSYPIPLTRLDEIDKPPNAYGWSMRHPLSETRELAFSFSGLASHAERLAAKLTSASTDERLLLARTTLGIAFEHLACRTLLALSSLRASGLRSTSHSHSHSHSPSTINTLVVSGGVASNPFLRYFFSALLRARGYEDIQLVFPPVELCTDNAAMIAWTGMEMYEAGWRSEMGILPVRKWSMDSEVREGKLDAEDEVACEGGDGEGEVDGDEQGEGHRGGAGAGGILGVDGWYNVKSTSRVDG